MFKVEDYRTFIFDCDGVVLKSNAIKTEAFYSTVRYLGEEFAESLVKYHVNNGGISRYKKFSWFVDEFFPGAKDVSVEFLVSRYAAEVQKKLAECEVAHSLDAAKSISGSAKWMIVSGGDQNELRHVFSLLDIDKYFEAGIYGSPQTKDQIVAREIDSRNIEFPAIFFGDSRYDFEVSVKFGFDFVFVSDWSELSDWQSFFANQTYPVQIVKHVSDFFLNK